MLDEYEHLRFLRSVEWFGRKCKIVHDVPEFREMLTPLDRISMEQDFADDLQRFSCYRDVALDFSACYAGVRQRTLLVHDTNKISVAVLFQANCKCCDTRSPPLNPGGHRRRMHHLP